MSPKKQSKKKSASKLIAAAKKQVEAKEAKIVKVKKDSVTPEQAKAMSAEIAADFQEWRKNTSEGWWHLGQKVEQFIDKRGPQALQKSFSEWIQEVFGDSWQRIRRAFLAFRALKNVPIEKLESLSEGNAYQLARLPEKIRKSPEWIKKADEMENDAFKLATDKFIEKKTGLKDPMLKLTDAIGFSTVPKSFFGIIEEAMTLAGRVNNFDVEGKAGRMSALEAIFADFISTYGGAQREERPNGPEVTSGDDEL